MNISVVSVSSLMNWYVPSITHDLFIGRTYCSKNIETKRLSKSCQAPFSCVDAYYLLRSRPVVYYVTSVCKCRACLVFMIPINIIT